MIKKIPLIIMILTVSIIQIFASTIPSYVFDVLKEFKQSGLVEFSSEFPIEKIRSRYMISREVNNVIYNFAKSPNSFSSAEIQNLGKLAGEFSEELRLINSSNLSKFTTILRMLTTKIETTKSYVMSSRFHTLGKNGEIENKTKIVHGNVVSAEVHTERAIKLFYLGRYTKSMLELNNAIAKYPNYLTAHFWLGRVFVKKGEYRKAIGSWQKVVNSLGNKIYISDFIQRKSDFNEVFMEILEVLSAYPDDNTANNLLKTLQDNLRLEK
ncbi:MAG: hypothetical protein C0601_02090 [Candidatus Muiribacterium halophilum]|uniref:Uncharacterized protein n=1 Tax=Muiribacterium halophilum TaxID=2053465 RepID=A0A2N5ZL81_MUIH1|nr:MAG: hypothetical protein C0601_02090 [Candidatus Muirbacterium halophilum]